MVPAMSCHTSCVVAPVLVLVVLQSGVPEIVVVVVVVRDGPADDAILGDDANDAVRPVQSGEDCDVLPPRKGGAPACTT